MDVDTLPQMLISRVDVVTGGACAVYGSDAVTGVVNFVLNKKFDGVKFDINTGISTYADAMSYNLGAGGRHRTCSAAAAISRLRWNIVTAIRSTSRPAPMVPTILADSDGEAGTGTAANPFNRIANARRPNSTFGGLVQALRAGLSAGQPACSSIAGGALVPFYPGIAGATDANGNPTAGTGNFNSGGDGAYNPYGQVFNGYHQGALFGRFSYDLADNINCYVQGTASEAYSFGWYFPQKIQPGVNQAAIFYKNNPFLSAAVQTQLGNNGTNPTQLSATVQAGNTFQLGEFLVGNGQTEINATGSVNRVLSMRTGFDGTLMDGRFAWNLFYTHGENRLAVDLINNQNLQHMYASEDAVLTPSGTVACYAATQAATAASLCRLRADQSLRHQLREPVGFQIRLPDHEFPRDQYPGQCGRRHLGQGAGRLGAVRSPRPCRAKRASTPMTSPPARPAAPLWIARACASAIRRCPAGPSRSFRRSMPARMCGNSRPEAEVPVIKDVPLIKAFDLNLAGRYTDYSVSGSVQTWKIGFNWNVVDSLRFRGTTSIDIRAPTLDDLFRPATLVQNVFNGDLHIPDPNKPGQFLSYTTTFSSQGNPNLVPEVARTYTVGAVWTPDFIPGLTVSLDYFRIHLANAIGSIGPSTTIQTLCEASGGTSIYCHNYQRPLPFSDHTTANQATKIFTFNLNTASHQDRGLGLRDQLCLGHGRHRPGLERFLDRPPAGDLSAGHQQLGADPGPAFHPLRRFQHPHHLVPELRPERLELWAFRTSGCRASARWAVRSCRPAL